MDYKIIDIEGIGDVYAEKLIAAGINKVSELLEKCAAPKGRKALAEETGISEKLILKWTNHADLFRINGVGPQFGVPSSRGREPAAETGGDQRR